MLKKYLSMSVIGLLIYATSVAPGLANSRETKDRFLPEQVKEKVANLGVGEKARVTVKLRDKTEVKGYVYQAGDDNFVVRDTKNGKTTTIAYSDVTKLKGGGLSTGAKVGIGIGIGVGLAFLAGWIIQASGVAN